MIQQADPRLRKRLSSLPEPVLHSTRFLLWKKVWNEKRAKFLKVPYYVNGAARGGTKLKPIELDSPEDLAGLATLDAVLSEYERTGSTYSGVGFALVGEGIGAFDLDGCLTPDGELKPDHPGATIAIAAEARGAYMEISPSGSGLRILGPSSIPSAYSKAALEYWGAGRFVTLTGSVWASPGGWKDLTDLRAPLDDARDKERLARQEESEVLVTPRLVEELRSALATMDADERTLWVAMGHALKPLGSKGLDLWLEYSAKSPKFKEQDARTSWDTFHPTQTNHKAVFAEAQRNWGWQNPRSRQKTFAPDNTDDLGQSGEAEDKNEASTRSILDQAVDLGDLRLYPTEFVLDGFLPVGVTLIAGAWGAGKSTNLIPVFAAVAHLSPQSWNFNPQLRRHVIWVTEAPDQARDTLYSLAQSTDAASWADFKTWFHIVPARRKPAKQLAKELALAIPVLTYPTDKGFEVHPVVVLDTTSANLDLENESDNSEVGKAMAALKEKLPGLPIVLIGHTPKAMVRADVSDMTFRGAGAWEADAVATYYLVHDLDTGMRFMALRKSRFSPDYTEISFGQEGGRELVNTPWGEPQSKVYIHGVPCRSTGEERKAAARAIGDERKEEEKARGLTERQTRIVEAIMKAAAEHNPLTRGRLRSIVSGKVELVVEALNRLVEAGIILVVAPPEDLRERFKVRQMVPDILLPSELNQDQFFLEIRAQSLGNG